MKLQGLHHITMSTGAARRNVEFLRVPKMHAHLREQLERTLTRLVNPRTARRERVGA
jgi:hypothetical protein